MALRLSMYRYNGVEIELVYGFGRVNPDPGGGPGTTPVKVGALPNGNAAYYPVLGAVNKYVNSDPDFGSNSNDGSQATPYLTIAYALSQTPTNGYIWLREGDFFNESILFSSAKKVTISAFPLEAVNWDGSQLQSTWNSNPNGTWTTPYTVNLQAFDYASAGSYSLTTDPMGNDPIQCWIDGVAQVQIANNAVPAAGQFSVNRTSPTTAPTGITIGTNPTGKEVRASKMVTALTVGGSCLGVDLFGFCIRRFSPNAMGGVNATAVYYGGNSHGSVMENMHFEDTSVNALWITKTNCTVRNCSFKNSGHAMVNCNVSSGLTFQRNHITRVNRHLWEQEPTTAALKVTRARNCLVEDNMITDTPLSYGIWYDVSVMRTITRRNWLDGASTLGSNAATGIHHELSGGGNLSDGQGWSYTVGNYIYNYKVAIQVLNSDHIKLWNNLCSPSNASGTGHDLLVKMDNRSNPGTDLADQGATPTECPWVTTDIHSGNNDFVKGGSNFQQLFVYVSAGTSTLKAWQMLEELHGCRFQDSPSGIMARFGTGTAGATANFQTVQALIDSGSNVGGPPGAHMSNCVQGSTPPTPVVIPDDVCVALGIANGVTAFGPVHPPVVLAT